MCGYRKRGGVKPVSKYEFQEQLCMYWLNPTKFFDMNKKTNNTFKIHTKASQDTVKIVTLLSTMLMDSAFVTVNAQKRSLQCCNGTLAENGSLRCRLNTTLSHLPERQQTKKAKCALHCWVGIKKQAPVLHYPTCDIYLCVDCYGIFHIVPNIIGMKKHLGIDIKLNVIINSVYYTQYD